MASAVTIWHRLLQMASTVTNGIDCYKWHRLLQYGIDCLRKGKLRHRVTLSLPSDHDPFYQFLQHSCCFLNRFVVLFHLYKTPAW